MNDVSRHDIGIGGLFQELNLTRKHWHLFWPGNAFSSAPLRIFLFSSLPLQDAPTVHDRFDAGGPRGTPTTIVPLLAHWLNQPQP